MDHSFIKYLPSCIRTRIEGRHILQKAISNTSWLFADKIIRMGVGLLVGVWIARYLGPEQFGIYNYAIAFVALFSAFSTLGLDGIVIRNIVRDPSCKEETLGSAFILKLFGGTATLLLTLGTIFLLRPDDSLTHWMVGIIAAGFIFQAFDVVDFWFQSQIQSKYVVYAKNVAFLAISLAKIVLIFFKAPLIAFAWAGLAEIILGSIGLIMVYRIQRHYLKNWRVNLVRVRSLLKDSWPLILSGIVIMIYMRIDQVMLGELATNKEVGIYSAAVRLVEVWYFIPMTITASIFPVIVESKNLDKKIYELRMQRLYDLMIWMAIVIAVLMSISSKLIINILFGNEYKEAASVLMLQAWMSMAVFFGVARHKWLISEGYIKYAMQLEVLGALLNVACNIILIPAYGAFGAAIASLLAAFSANFVLAIYSKPIRQSLKKYIIGLMLPIRLIKSKLCVV